jgi:hypothetical protein
VASEHKKTDITTSHTLKIVSSSWTDKEKVLSHLIPLICHMACMEVQSNSLYVEGEKVPELIDAQITKFKQSIMHDYLLI